MQLQYKYLPLYTSKADFPSLFLGIDTCWLCVKNAEMVFGCLSKRLCRKPSLSLEKLVTLAKDESINSNTQSASLTVETISKGRRPFDRTLSRWNPASIIARMTFREDIPVAVSWSKTIITIWSVLFIIHMV